VVKLTARMKHGQHHLNGGLFLGFVHIDRDTTTVVLNKWSYRGG
jgi:hypothetical protein